MYAITPPLSNSQHHSLAPARLLAIGAPISQYQSMLYDKPPYHTSEISGEKKHCGVHTFWRVRLLLSYAGYAKRFWRCAMPVERRTRPFMYLVCG